MAKRSKIIQKPEQPPGGMIATARNDVTIPMFTTVLSPLDDTLIVRGDGKGLKLYDEVERDTHAYALLQKRKFALVARDWVVKAASDAPLDQRAAEFVTAQLQKMPFDQICLDLLDATLKGFSVAEIIWQVTPDGIVPEKIVSLDQRRFSFDENWRPRLRIMTSMNDGIDLPERKFIVHRFGVKGNDPYGLGLGSKLFWPVLFKREGVAFWLKFLEKYASPTPVGKYPLGTLDADQRKLLASLQDMVQSGALVVPIGAEVSFLETIRSGNAGYQEWCEYWDNQMSLCVFGSTLGTDIQGQGSRAASDVHKETEEQIIDGDADLLSATLQESLLRWLVELNVPGAAVPELSRSRPENHTAAEALREKRAANSKAELDNLYELAGRVPPEQFAEMAAALAGIDLLPHIPLDVLQKLAPHLARARVNLIEAARAGALPIPANDQTPAAQRVRQIALADGGNPDGHDHGMGAVATQLGQMAEPALRAWTARVSDEIRLAVAAGESFEALSARLLRLEPELTIDALGNVIAAAVEVAELSGRADVADEIAARKRKV